MKADYDKVVAYVTEITGRPPQSVEIYEGRAVAILRPLSPGAVASVISSMKDIIGTPSSCSNAVDLEYYGCVNAFTACWSHNGWRAVDLTASRTREIPCNTRCITIELYDFTDPRPT